MVMWLHCFDGPFCFSGSHARCDCCSCLQLWKLCSSLICAIRHWNPFVAFMVPGAHVWPHLCCAIIPHSHYSIDKMLRSSPDVIYLHDFLIEPFGMRWWSLFDPIFSMFNCHLPAVRPQALSVPSSVLSIHSQAWDLMIWCHHLFLDVSLSYPDSNAAAWTASLMRNIAHCNLEMLLSFLSYTAFDTHWAPS